MNKSKILLVVSLSIPLLGIGCKTTQKIANIPEPQTKTIEINYQEVAFTVQIPEEWEELYPGFEKTSTAQERSPLVILRSPQYDKNYKIIPWDMNTGAYFYIPIIYYNNNDSFDVWYGEHRKELINQFSSPADETNLTIDDRLSKKISFNSSRIVDPINNYLEPNTIEFVFIPLENKVLELRIEADQQLAEHFQREVSGLVGSIVIGNQLTFNSKIIDFSFKYPNNYGDVQEELRNTSNTQGLVQSGQAIWISFTGNKNVNIVLASQNYKAFKENVYSGSTEIDVLCLKEDIDETGNGCINKSVGSYKVVEQMEYIVDEGIYNLTHKYSIKLSGTGEYSGLTILQNFPQIYEELNQHILNDDRMTLANQYSSMILKGNAGEDIKKDIEDVETIVSTFKIK